MSLDIKDAYLHVPIFPPHQRYLRFAFQDHHYKFKSLPFGLMSAPQVFTKIMATATAAVRTSGISITPYLDDLLIKAPSLIEAQRLLKITMDKLQELGWVLNFDKLSLTHCQSIIFLGMQFNTQTQRDNLPQEKARHLRALVQSLLYKPLHKI